MLAWPTDHVLSGGPCPTVGVGGVNPGGGRGLLSRQLGLMSDSLFSRDSIRIR